MDTLFIIDCIIGGIFTVVHVIEDFFKHIFKIPYKALNGKRVLITGAARGLGKELAIQLAKEGCTLVLTDINETGLKETVKEINNKFQSTVALGITADVSDKTEIKKLHSTVQKERPIEILINNAGIVASNAILDHTDDQIRKIIDVNLMANIHMVRQFLPDMLKENTGHIVCISSVAAFTAATNTSAYFASKYAVTGFMNCLREELRSRKDNRVVTTTVHPSFLDSSADNVKHWEANSKLRFLSVPATASEIIEGIKMEKATLVIPGYLYYLINLLKLFPIEVLDLWRDILKTDIKPSDTNKY